MPQLFCAPRSVPEPYVVHRGDTTSACVTVQAPVAIAWSDGTVEDPAYAEDTTAQVAYGGVAFDAVGDAWLLMAVQGRPHPTLVKESDYPAQMDSLLGGGQWARIRRIENGVDYPCPQV